MPRPPSAAAAVRREVAGFDARSARERESRERFLRELDRLGDDPFDREAGRVHVTGSALVLGPRGTVLHVHRKLGRWLQPGGHVDAGEMPADAALREAREETGLPVRHPGAGPFLVHLDVHPAADDHVHLDLRYLLLSDDAVPAPGPTESQDVRWWRLEDALRVADDGLVEGIARLAALSGGVP